MVVAFGHRNGIEGYDFGGCEPGFVALNRIEADGDHQIGGADGFKNVAVEGHAGSDAEKPGMVFGDDAFHFGGHQKGTLKAIDDIANRGRERRGCAESNQDQGTRTRRDAIGDGRDVAIGRGLGGRLRNGSEFGFLNRDVARE